MKRSRAINGKEQILSKLVKLLFASVMIGAGVLILILFENLMPLNIYFIYLSIGVILGLSVIAIISTFNKTSDY